MKRHSGVLGAYLGTPACYRPEDDVICLGMEQFWILWDDSLKQGITKEQAFARLIKMVCHEEDHRVIYHVTKSKRACLHFDLLFTALFDYKENHEYFVW